MEANLFFNFNLIQYFDTIQDWIFTDSLNQYEISWTKFLLNLYLFKLDYRSGMINRIRNIILN